MIGIVTGLAAEARIASRLGRALPGGGLPAGAARTADRLAAEGATALVSFGLAGGLGDLAPGTLVIPRYVMTETVRAETDAALSEWLGGSTGNILFSANTMAATLAAKSDLRRRTGADAVDLESGAVAKVARARGLPFAALRAICDPADAELPPAALVALSANGRIGLGRVLGSLLRHPGQFSALLHLAGQARTARGALVRQARSIKGKAPAATA